MQEIRHTDKVFDKADFSNSVLPGKEFEACTFSNCEFSSADLSGNDFIDCLFENCNLSMVRLEHTGLKNITFQNCKLLGVDFSNSKEFLFEGSFDGCILDFASFIKRKLKNTVFRECSIKEANFTQADLTGSAFINCDLGRTIFQQTILEKADMRLANNFSIDPEANRIRKARFSLTGLTGLLEKYDIEVG